MEKRECFTKLKMSRITVKNLQKIIRNSSGKRKQKALKQLRAIKISEKKR